MDDRLPESAVTYASVAIIKTDDGRIAAGIELSKRSTTEEGRIVYVPYFVLSWYADNLRTPTKKQTVPTILADAIPYVDRDSRLVIFQSFSRTFYRRREYRQEVGLIAGQRGLDVIIKYMDRPLFVSKGTDSIKLAEDALKRGYTIAMPV